MTDYIEYDEYGLKEIRCMVCRNTVVSNRTYIEIPHKHNIGETVQVLTMQRLSSWQQPQKIEVEIGGITTFVEPIVCSECMNEPLDTEEVLDQIVTGWGLELKQDKKMKDKDINDWKKDHKIKKKEK